MKKYFIIGAAAALLTTSCSTDVVDNTEVDNTGKEKILLSAGDDQSALISRAGFTQQTRIVARIVSESRGGEAAECVKTVLTASAAEMGKEFSNVSYASDTYVRYWDDAHGRNSKLSVYAVAVPDKDSYTKESVTKYYIEESKLSGDGTWSSSNTDANSIKWTVSGTQTTEKLDNEDLAYSNNIQAGNVGGNSVYTWDYTNKKYPENGATNAIKHTINTTIDGRLYFTQSSNENDLASAPTEGVAGHFDKGQMEFKHALSRIQVNLIKGDGYSSATFDVTGMQVLGQSLTGDFDIKTAAWSNKGTATAIDMAKWTTAASRTDGKTNAATYEAQMLPGYTFTENDIANTLQLTVDGNTYYITNGMLYTALGANGKTTEMGKRYIFDITVGKNKIQNITATIVPWNDVTAENTNVNNSHATFTFYGSNTSVNKCRDVKLWKYEQELTDITIGNSYTTAPAVANTAYTAVLGFARVDDTDTYTTSEYYNDNKTAYHFRSTNAATALDAGAKTFTMSTGNTDYHWGAPMKTGLTSSKLPYSLTEGYLSSIDKGIVAASTESNINLTEVHMMSQLVIKLTSIPLTGQTESAKVTLAGAKVKLTKLSNNGTVDMGSGLITPTTTITSYPAADAFVDINVNDGVYSCTINVIPQALVRNGGASDDDYVGITIKTTDNNEYYIVKRLSEIIATSVGSEITNMQEAGAGKYITRWYPGHKYIYTFNITKTEIKNITATIVGWNEVVAGNTNLDLEK